MGMATKEFQRMFSGISKTALIDALWCACQLGYEHSDQKVFETEITKIAAWNAKIALLNRGENCPGEIDHWATKILA